MEILHQRYVLHWFCNLFGSLQYIKLITTLQIIQLDDKDIKQYWNQTDVKKQQIIKVQNRIVIGGETINNIRYVDDTMIVAGINNL